MNVKKEKKEREKKKKKRTYKPFKKVVINKIRHRSRANANGSINLFRKEIKRNMPPLNNECKWKYKPF